MLGSNTVERANTHTLSHSQSAAAEIASIQHAERSTALLQRLKSQCQTASPYRAASLWEYIDIGDYPKK